MPAARLPRLVALLPLLALSPSLAPAARAQGAVETAPPLVLENNVDGISGLSLYVDPSTGYTYGPDLDHPYVPNPGGATVISSSALYTFTNVDTPVGVADHTYATTVDATLGGTSVFDMTFDAPFSDPSVQAAVAQADALLSAGGAAYGTPTLASSALTGLGSSTTYVQTGEAATGATTETSTQTFGPATITGPNLYVAVGGGAYYPPGFSPSGLFSPPYTTFTSDFYILPGQLDINLDGTVPIDVSRTVTTTTTDLLTQQYDIVGTPNAAPAVPEPSALALLALGLLPVGFVATRRKIVP